VLSELRETQRQSQLAPGSHYDFSLGASHSIAPASLARTPGLLTPDILALCVEYYFANLYPTQPILHRQRVQEAIISMDHSIEAYVKLCGMCAYVLFQPNMMLPPGVQPGIDSSYLSASGVGHLLLDEAIRVRKGYEFFENPTIVTIYTSFFVFCAYFCLDRQNAAWCYLREALTLAHVIGLHDEETYKTDDYITSSRKRRMFWTLFISERCK
jgi:Fungal specific transcription factor domain